MNRTIRGVLVAAFFTTLLSLPLVALAFACALAGKGKARVPLALLAVFGLLLWTPIGFL